MMRLWIVDCGLRMALLTALMVLTGCGKPDPANRHIPPDQVLEFGKLYAQNCAGCHGKDGRLGPAPPLADPLFLAIISDQELREVIAQGRHGTPMAAFERREGGLLTTQQVDALVAGLRQQWGKPEEPIEGKLPSYRQAREGDVQRGAKVFGERCASCHGPDGKGGDAGAIHDAAYLMLASNQRLRRIIITGRADLGMPGGGSSNKPLTEEQIADLVALLASWRSEYGSAK